MDYFVIGADGKEYGPANIATLSEWVKDNRVNADTQLKDFQTGRVLPAGSVRELFPSGPPPPMAAPGIPPGMYQQPPTPYPRGYQGSQNYGSDNSDIYWALGRSALALLIFFFLHRLALIFAVFGVVYAFRAQQNGHRHGVIAIVLSVVTLLIICGGLWLSMNSPVRY